MRHDRTPIRVHARHPLVIAFIRAWNALIDAPLYLAGPGYRPDADEPDLIENTGPWERMYDAADALLADPAAVREARYLMLDSRSRGDLTLP